MINYLLTLGLEPTRDYTAEEVKKAWREKCKEHHPDKFQDEGEKKKNELVFMEVTHAYKMLTDPSYRKQESDRTKGRKGDLNIRMQVPINFEDAFFGNSFKISYNRVELDKEGQGIVKEEQEIITIDIPIPAGCGPGHEITYSGHGLKCGDAVGDCYVTIVPKTHKKFRVEQSDVVADEQIPLDIMLKGGEVEVQTMYGLRTLKVPPGTSPGERLKVKKCGVKKRGHHYVVVHPVYPTKEDLQKKDSWKSLDINWENKEEELDPDEQYEEMFKRAQQQFRFTFGGGTTG